jgi:hypothetical protein
MISPPPQSTLPATNVTFTWNATAEARKYWLDVGTRLGAGDIFAG